MYIMSSCNYQELVKKDVNAALDSILRINNSVFENPSSPFTPILFIDVFLLNVYKKRARRVEMTEKQKSKNEDEEIEEFQHFTRVLNAFRNYKRFSTKQIETCKQNFKALPEQHQELVPNHLEILNELNVSICHNQEILNEILKTCENAFQNKSYQELGNNEKIFAVRPMDMEKIQTTLKQIMRDWSSEGQAEREQSYRPIIDEILSRFPFGKDKDRPHILVPGCGLGRLAWEIAHIGYNCEGNEFSFFMLFTANFILNRTPHSKDGSHHQFVIYPWATQRSNVSSWGSALTPVKFPDINPALIPSTASFSMAAGDFLEVYTKEASWNCVATCYFIDTANNIISYLHRIYHILVPGGIWINFGPLLYHFQNMKNEPSVEFSYEQIIEIVNKVGFQILKDERGIDSTYVNNSSSMLQYNYKCAFLVAKKPESKS